jgi:hypothetical protein
VLEEGGREASVSAYVLAARLSCTGVKSNA